MTVTMTGQPYLDLQSRKLEYDSKGAMLFRPPLSPAPSSDGSRQHTNSRKRSRASSPSSGAGHTPSARRREQHYGYFDSAPLSSQAATWSSITPNASFEPLQTRSAASPPPFVETRYSLAYGAHGMLEETDAADSDSGRTAIPGGGRRWSEKDELEHSQNKQRPSAPNGAPSLPAGLTSLVFGIVSGVAGRVLDFCKQSAPFKGFHAGGGPSYMLPCSPGGNEIAYKNRAQQEDPDASTLPCSPFEFIATPIPGQFPESPPQERETKRRRGDGGGWVMIPSTEKDSLQTTHNKSRPRLSVQPPLTRRSSSTSNVHRSASRGDSRRSVAPTMVARRYSSNATHAGSPTARGRTASTASPRAATLRAASTAGSGKRHSSASRPSMAAGDHNEMPGPGLSPDAQKYQARMKRQEREQDKSMRQMNAKLQALIAEGQAALGARVDECMDDTDFE